MATSIELLSGVILASLLITIARWQKQENRIFGIILVLTAVYYVIKAFLGGTQQELFLELTGLVVFGILGVLGLYGWRWFLAIGWASHAAWDVILHTDGRGAYVPEWYPMLCVGFDIFLAGFIVGLAVLHPRQNE